MNDGLRAVLRSLPSRLKSSWVFPSVRGHTPLNAKNYMNRVFVPALKRAGINDFHWRDLRHCGLRGRGSQRRIRGPSRRLRRSRALSPGLRGLRSAA
jgi:hypothetical protein